MDIPLNEERLIRSMVRVLRERPGEWLTFGKIARLVGEPSCDADLVGAIADYRDDLFAVTRDRKLKLRPNVTEGIAVRGIENWKVPARPEKEKPRHVGTHVGGASGISGAKCYCELPYEEILSGLQEGAIPDEALVYSCCWKTICRVRGLYFNSVDDEIWREICTRRGYIRSREDPRGF
jgi:hypothetical protein